MAVFGFRRVEPTDPEFIPVYFIEGSGMVVEKKESSDGAEE